MEQNRPTKKQRELLSFIDSFIKGNGYGPSYREIMRALDYKSVSTVAVHVDGLIARGFLQKRTHSARSLEVVTDVTPRPQKDTSSHEAWFKSEIEKRQVLKTEDAEILVKAAHILGFVDIPDISDEHKHKV